MMAIFQAIEGLHDRHLSQNPGSQAKKDQSALVEILKRFFSTSKRS